MVPAIVDEKTWVPELDREDLLYHRLFLAEKWLVLKLRYGHADPRDAGVGNIVNCGAAMYIAPVGIANAGDPDGAYAEALDLTAAHQSSYGREAAGVLAAAVAEALRPEATVGHRSSRRACGSRRTARARRSRQSSRRRRSSTAGATAGSRRCGAAFAPFDSVGERYARAGAERADPEPAALDRGGADRARAARRDRRRLRPRRSSAASTTAATRTRSRRWAARSRVRSAASRVRRDWVEEVSAASKIDIEEAGRTMAAVAAEIFAARRHRHEERARALAAAATAGRGACLRVTWVQPEDLVGHELRQAREEGKDVDAVEARWLGAGGAPAPATRRLAGAGRRRSCGRSRSSCSTSSRRCRGRWPPRSRTASTRSSPRPIRRPRGAGRRPRRGSPARGSAGRRAACSASRSRTSRARGSARSREATGNWPVAGWFTAEGLPDGGLGALAVEPREPPDEPRREHRRDARGRRPQLHDARRRAARALRHRLRLARRGEALARLPAARPDLHGRARRDAEPARGVPAAGDGDAPQPVPRVDRRAAARRRVRLGRRAATRSRRADGVGGRAREPHRERRLRGDVHGGRARGLAVGVVRGGVRRRRPLGRPALQPARRGDARRRASSRGSSSGRRSSTSCTRATATPLGARDQQHRARRRGALRVRRRLHGRRSAAVVQGGWDTDTNGAAVGSILGALVGPAGSRSAGRRRSTAASRARCPASTGSRSTSSRGARSPWLPRRPRA